MKSLLLLPVLFIAFNLNAQSCAACHDDIARTAFNNPIVDYNNAFVENSERNRTVGNSYASNSLANSFLGSFNIAKLTSDDKSIYVMARFNPINNEMEIQLDEGIINLNKIANITLQFRDSKKNYECLFYLDNKGKERKEFFEVSSLTRSDVVYVKEKLTYVNAKKGVTSYDKSKPATYKRSVAYFHKNLNNELLSLSLKKRNIKSSFPEYSKDILKFIKMYGTNEDNMNSLVQLVGYIKRIETHTNITGDTRLAKND